MIKRMILMYSYLSEKAKKLDYRNNKRLYGVVSGHCY